MRINAALFFTNRCREPLRRSTWMLLLVLFWGVSGFADLQVYPTRIEMNEHKRVAHISLRHLGTKPASYRISAVFYRMNEDGSLVEVKDPTPQERSLVKYLHFSPRRTTIPPNLEQVVRVMFAGHGDLPDGEYRAHLHFEPDDDDSAPPPTNPAPGKITLSIRSQLALSIPVIFRKGNPTYTVALSDLTLNKSKDGKQSFSLTMTATGNAFPYGDFEAYFIPKGSHTPESVGAIRGVACYIPKRTVTSRIDLKKAGPGTLRVEFHEPQDNGVSGKLITSVETEVK